MSRARYITTTLPYVNADPHLGFALELVQADTLVRFWKLAGDEVFFNTGTDEYGQKIAEKATEESVPIQEYVNEHAERFRALKKTLGLDDEIHFVRTTSEAHKKAAQEMWKRCYEKGDIEKRKYKGKYCVGDEMFVRESDLVNGRCPHHPTMELREIEEENYFFKFSKYEKELLAYLKKESVIVPEWRRKEAVLFVESGLSDFSISREKERMSWGIPVPHDETQVMYVWFDALTNYISTLGWPDERGDFDLFWKEGEVVQVAGKDQVRFQSLMWQAMLFSVGVKNTDHVFYHGFITSGGQKMSKSLGNVIAPEEVVKKYGVDATRYFLLRHVHPFEDTDITRERLDEWYEGNLVNGLGNLVARVMKLAEMYLDTPLERPAPTPFSSEYTEALETYSFNEALDLVWGTFQALDQKITETEPFKMVKEDPEKGKQLIQELALELYVNTRLLTPFMPETSVRIKETILLNKKPENLFPRL